jgi:hypothetical protein
LSVAAGWFSDPSGRHAKRYFNGEAWTDRVLDGALHASDPIGGVTSQPQSSANRGSIAPTHVVVASRPAGNGFAVAGLTLGIIGVVMALSPFGFAAGGFFGLIGLLFGLLGIRNVRVRGATLGGLAIAGIALGSIAVAIGINHVLTYKSLGNAIDDALAPPKVVAAIEANPVRNKVKVTSCYRDPASRAPAATGTLVNTSRAPEAFTVTVAFEFETATVAPVSTTVYGVTTTDYVPPGETVSWTVLDRGATFPPKSCTVVARAPAQP